MTAVGYAFARCLHETLAVPVGIVSCNQGASRVESWTDPALLEEEMCIRDRCITFP